MKFKNQYGYYVGNAFLPSLLLVIVCYLTFWFSIDDFQVRKWTQFGVIHGEPKPTEIIPLKKKKHNKVMQKFNTEM